MITNLEDDKILNEIEKVFDEKYYSEFKLSEIIKFLKNKLDIEQFKKVQNYEGFDKEEVNKLINEIDLQEPIEDLLDMI